MVRQGHQWFCQRHKKDYFRHLLRRTHRWRPVRGGLYDAEIFGANPFLVGGQETKDDRETQEKVWRERFGYIRLACEVKNPLTKEPMTFLPILPAAFRFRLDPDDPEQSRLDRPGKKSLDWLYARIVRINNALRNPAQTGRYSEEDLQEAIWHLFRGYEGDKTGKCLERLIKGKHGIFRQAVLGKRTDYSGRAVIVPDPELALDECRLPYRVGVELLRPWLKGVLLAAGHSVPLVEKLLSAQHAGKKARQGVTPPASVEAMVEQILSTPEKPEHRHAIEQAWSEALRIGEYRRVCILNRAPTLHKFNLLAFTPKLWDEAVIAIPPLVCAGYNADFDGDTIAVHLPLTAESQREAREYLSPSKNLRSPANGQLVLHLAQDILAGLAYKQLKESGEPPKEFAQRVRAQVAAACDVVQEALNCMREGFAQATQAGLSFGLFDIPLIENRQEILRPFLDGRPLAAFYDGTVNADERQQIADRWKEAVTGQISTRLEEGLQRRPTINALALLTLSGARGDEKTIAQLGGMRGLMERGSSEHTAYPIESNFVEGLSPLEFFFSTFGSRASLVDKKLKVADAGDFTRRLVNCAYNLRITRDDCRTARESRSVLTCEAPDGICQRCYGKELNTNEFPPLNCPVGLIAATSIGERGTQLSMRTFHTGGVKGDNITRGLPHVNALLENRWIEVPRERWEQYGSEAKARGSELGEAKPAGRILRFRLGKVAHTVDDARTIVLGEVYQNYKKKDLPPFLFAVILRAMIRWENGKMQIRGLTQAARENLYPLERVAFRDAIGHARDNAKQAERGEIKGVQEKIMVANL